MSINDLYEPLRTQVVPFKPDFPILSFLLRTIWHHPSHSTSRMGASDKKAKPKGSGRQTVKGMNFMRDDEKKIKRIKMLANGHKAVRDRNGKIVEAAEFQSREAKPGLVQPDRRWFGASALHCRKFDEIWLSLGSGAAQATPVSSARMHSRTSETRSLPARQTRTLSCSSRTNCP